MCIISGKTHLFIFLYVELYILALGYIPNISMPYLPFLQDETKNVTYRMELLKELNSKIHIMVSSQPISWHLSEFLY